MGENKKIGFFRLCIQAIPELAFFQIFMGILLVFLVHIFRQVAVFIISAKAPAVISSNISDFILNFRGLLLVPIGILLILLYMAMELFSQIYLCDAILKGEKASVFGCLRQGFKSISKFLNPAGISILLFIVAVVPLVGVGLSLSLTENFYIPNFIMSFIESKTLLFIIYNSLIFAGVVIGFLYFYCLHGVLLKGLTARASKKYSIKIMKENWKDFIKSMLVFTMVTFVVSFTVVLVFYLVPQLVFSNLYADLPINYTTPSLDDYIDGVVMTDADAIQIGYRILSVFIVMIGIYVLSMLQLLMSSFFILQVTRLFYRYDNGICDVEAFVPRPRKKRYLRKMIFMIAIVGVIGVFSVFAGLLYQDFFKREDVPIVAHRLGGTTTTENSLEGLRNGIEDGCYGFETDVQRTKDGHYIINHDDTFLRLTGVNKAPYEMTMEEIDRLRINNEDGTTSKVITLEELLDAAKGNGILFIELKGKTADRQMVDDVVKMVKEKDAVDDVMLISLKYDVIDYAKQTYPEFETGLLFFAGMGDFEKLNCDVLIMEEELADSYGVYKVHDAGKKIMVWTVNTESGLRRFLDEDIDGVITDKIDEAVEVEKSLNNRTDYEVISDTFNIFN